MVEDETLRIVEVGNINDAIGVERFPIGAPRHKKNLDGLAAEQKTLGQPSGRDGVGIRLSMRNNASEAMVSERTSKYFDSLFLLLAAPLMKRRQNSFKIAAIFGEGIFHARRNLGEDGARNEAIGFHFAQLLGQNFGRDAFQSALQFSKAARAAE